MFGGFFFLPLLFIFSDIQVKNSLVDASMESGMYSTQKLYESEIERESKREGERTMLFSAAFIDEVGKMLSVSERLVPNSKNFVMHELSRNLSAVSIVCSLSVDCVY